MFSNKIRNQNFKNQKGASLIEVMVSLVVLGVGILGLVSMQVQSLRLNSQAYNYSKAVFLANDILERMRTNASVADQYVAKGLPMNANRTPSCYGSAAVNCTLGQIVTADLEHWSYMLQQSLPGVSADIEQINTATNPLYRISIQFNTVEVDGVTSVDASSGGGNKEKYVLVSGV